MAQMKKNGYGQKTATQPQANKKMSPNRMAAADCVKEATKRMNAAGMHQKVMDSDGM